MNKFFNVVLSDNEDCDYDIVEILETKEFGHALDGVMIQLPDSRTAIKTIATSKEEAHKIVSESLACFYQD